MNKLIYTHSLLLLIACIFPAGSWAQRIANPLVQPALLSTVKEEKNGTATAPQTATSSAEAEELRQQAARRITQEDLNVRQQQLNLPVVPQGLINLFGNMQVTAHIQGAIVMRKLTNDVAQATAASVSTDPKTGTQAAPDTSQRQVSRSSSVIRLKVGEVINVAGYSVRAKVVGQDVTVDWLSDKGAWINVFFGALESSNEGVSQMPADSKLLKVETEAFNYLVPALNRGLSGGPAAGGRQGGGNGNFGSPTSGLNQGFGQPGFGSSAPF
jgi:hypothetical protein